MGGYVVCFWWIICGWKCGCDFVYYGVVDDVVY